MIFVQNWSEELKRLVPSGKKQRPNRELSSCPLYASRTGSPDLGSYAAIAFGHMVVYSETGTRRRKGLPRGRGQGGGSSARQPDSISQGIRRSHEMEMYLILVFSHLRRKR